MKYFAILLAFLMLASPVYANGGGEGDNTDCQGQGNPNSPCDPGDDDDDHDHDDHDHDNDGGGNGGSGGAGGSGTGVGVGVGVGIGIGGGADVNVDNSNDNVNIAGGGDASIYIGGAGSECYEGECEGGNGAFSNENNVSNDSTAVAGASSSSDNQNDNSNEVSNEVVTNVDVVVEGDDVVYEAAKIPVNSSASVYSGICNSGASGSGSRISLAFAVTSDVCMDLMMADAYSARGNEEQVDYWIERAAKHAKWKGAMGMFRTVITLGIL